MRTGLQMLGAVPDGYSACAGISDAGWYGGVLALAFPDVEYLDIPEDASYEERATHCRKWSEAGSGIPRRIILVSGCGDVSQEQVAQAEYVEGPVCPREKVSSPVLAWVERDADNWRVVLYRDGSAQCVFESDDVIRCLRIALAEDGLLFAIERDTGPSTTTVDVLNEQGEVVHSVAGRVPVLCAAGAGYVLLTEQSHRNAVHLLAHYVENGSVVASKELSEGDYLFNADVAWSEKEQAVVLAAESSPCFGYSNQIGKYRTIHTWQWDLSSNPSPMGVLPVEERAFHSFIAPENISPIRPRVLVSDDGLSVLFKQHRYFGMKTFGWDVFVCRHEQEQWRDPIRITEALTGSDTTFGLVPVGKDHVGIFPAHDNTGGPGRSTNFRAEIVRFGPDHELPRFEIPEEKKGEHEIPVSYKDISAEPPDLKNAYEGRQLIWGDIHIHSIYSQCVAAVDGTPEENIRYVRDVLGCRVFAMTEHTPWIVGPMANWDWDRIESTVGKDNVLLYAMEPGCKRMRHTNWYARDRATHDRLQRIIVSQDKEYHEILRQVREDLPKDSVLVLRHFHGNAIPEETIPEQFVPEFEVAMESMQGRCNAMIDPREGQGKFPNPFLDAGCRIGLVGGTDHFRVCPNHFCLTGFWVKEVSVDGVWEALRNRFTFAMSDSRVAMFTSCKGLPMGSEVKLAEGEEMRVVLNAACAKPVLRATLMRDGELLPWTEVKSRTAQLELSDPNPGSGYHWYVPTVEVETAYGEHTGICHGSPYFVKVS